MNCPEVRVASLVIGYPRIGWLLETNEPMSDACGWRLECTRRRSQKFLQWPGNTRTRRPPSACRNLIGDTHGPMIASQALKNRPTGAHLAMFYCIQRIWHEVAQLPRIPFLSRLWHGITLKNESDRLQVLVKKSLFKLKSQQCLPKIIKANSHSCNLKRTPSGM